MTTHIRKTPYLGHPLTRAEVLKITKLGPLYDFLDHYAAIDTYFEKFDFRGDTIPADDWALANGSGASVASYAVNVQRSGYIRATTGTAGDATASASMISPAIYYGDAYCSAIWVWKPVTAVTDVQIEMGFADVVPGSNKPVVNSVVTPTVNTSVVDAAVYRYNNASSVTTNTLVTIGSTISAAKTAFTAPTTVAAGTVNKVRIQLIVNRAYLWMDGLPLAHHDSGTTDYVEGGDALALWAYIAAVSAVSKSHDIDLIVVSQDR